MAFKKRKRTQHEYDSPESLFHDLRNRKVEGLLFHQGDILKKYMGHFGSSDIAIELPTGSGKTLVGLLIAEFRRRTKQQRALYLCPTKQLVNQVVEQAEEKYGIKAASFTGSAKNFSHQDKSTYLSSECIAVATYSALFNINPFFNNAQTIILDDAHASENYIGSTWALNIIRKEHENLYLSILNTFKEFFDRAKYERLYSGEFEYSDLSWVEKIPTPIMLEKNAELSPIIETHIQNTELLYSWGFLRDKLYTCHIYISHDSILIRPYIPPSMTHKPFSDAQQRIYMSATLGAGGDLERITGVGNITRIPIPDGWDKQGIGRRYFIFPELAMPEEHYHHFLIELITIAKRALILVPSSSSAVEIGGLISNELKWPVLSAKEIEESKSNFTNKDKAVAILANRYDGIDMAGDDCRLLIVIGLPRAANLQERFMLTRMASSIILNDRIRTRIVQAIGRCTRSATDYAAVVMIGDDFQDWFILKEKQKLFHPELQGEIIFGIEQCSDANPDELIENFNIFWEHKEEWQDADSDILYYRDNTQKESVEEEEKLFKAASLEVKYIYALWNQDYEKAYELAIEIANLYSGGVNIQGLRSLWNYFAGSAALLVHKELKKNHYHALADTLFIKAAAGASSVGWLRKLASAQSILDESKKNPGDFLLESNVERLDSLLTNKKYISKYKFEKDAKVILDGIGQDDYKNFEEAHMKLGELLGFQSENPKGDADPDPYWLVNDELCIVFEDKSNTKKKNPIKLEHVTQAAAQHPIWIKTNVKLKSDAKIIPVLLTHQENLAKGSKIHAADCRYWNIEQFRMWAKEAINTVRTLVDQYPGQGDLAWRADAIQLLSTAKFSPQGIIDMLDKNYLKTLPEVGEKSVTE